MKLKRKNNIKLSDLSEKEQKELRKAIDTQFPEDKKNWKEHQILEDLILDLYYDENNKFVGYICYDDDRSVCDRTIIQRFGVKDQNEKIATEMLSNFAKEHNRYIYMVSPIENDIKYLYHSLGFLVDNIIEYEGRKYYDFVYYKNEELTNVARVLNEVYQYSKIIKDQNFERALLCMYQNKFYDNLYQYNLNNRQIDKVIKDSPLFALGLSLIDYSKLKYHAAYNYNVRKNKNYDFFQYILDESYYEYMRANGNTLEYKTKKEVEDIFKILVSLNKDAVLVKDLNEEKQEQE